MTEASLFNHDVTDGLEIIGLGQLPLPGVCMKCGNGNYEGGYLNLGVWYEWEGTMLMCLNCVYQITEAVGGMVPDIANAIRDESRQVASENVILQGLVKDQNERLSAFATVISTINNTVGDSSDSLGVTNLEISVQDAGDPERPEQESSGEQPKSAESSKGNRVSKSERATRVDSSSESNHPIL